MTNLQSDYKLFELLLVSMVIFVPFILKMFSYELSLAFGNLYQTYNIICLARQIHVQKHIYSNIRYGVVLSYLMFFIVLAEQNHKNATDIYK